MPQFILIKRQGLLFTQAIVFAMTALQEQVLRLLPIVLLVLLIAIFRKRFKQKQFDIEKSVEETTGNFGTAAWASEADFKRLDMFSADNKIPIGQDAHGRVLYLPLLNKLTLSPQGGGKSTASSMLALLSYNGPMFTFDVKGELWVTTARYRAEVFKRKIVVIDPFRITKSQDFIKNKSADLLKDYFLNPFDWIPEDQKERDRMINSFASSFIINEGSNGGNAVHFDENAKILIRGYCEYMMHKLPKAARNLSTLYELLCEHQEDAKLTFEQMSQIPGRAAAAANQINRVGSDERGSILSTSYRQIDWMSDSNIQETLSKSNFDLNDFLKGDMDIFVVIPEDQVKEHSRLVRMILVLLKASIVCANPSELPNKKNKKMLFLLEELAQLGYCPDVEECIETLRARGIVIWGVFQTLSQIECYKKPDLFKTMPIKQIFTNDDEKLWSGYKN